MDDASERLGHAIGRMQGAHPLFSALQHNSEAVRNGASVADPVPGEFNAVDASQSMRGSSLRAR